eukprot:3679285-Rhodomonas_salina.6
MKACWSTRETVRDTEYHGPRRASYATRPPVTIITNRRRHRDCVGPTCSTRRLGGPGCRAVRLLAGEGFQNMLEQLRHCEVCSHGQHGLVLEQVNFNGHWTSLS